ncbi:unnamed protein product [Dovyalis caffra]|uniref:Uncharacterized protein n=1 Tax=Dovyalis caffra TaxID=77055 RepID=A0AAV1SM84_9ROSI|nr:unnamed protein product [Dovyalis caffra]
MTGDMKELNSVGGYEKKRNMRELSYVGIDELKQKLAYTILELESMKVAAMKK